MFLSFFFPILALAVLATARTTDAPNNITNCKGSSRCHSQRQKFHVANWPAPDAVVVAKQWKNVVENIVGGNYNQANVTKLYPNIWFMREINLNRIYKNDEQIACYPAYRAGEKWFEKGIYLPYNPSGAICTFLQGTPNGLSGADILKLAEAYVYNQNDCDKGCGSIRTTYLGNESVGNLTSGRLTTNFKWKRKNCGDHKYWGLCEHYNKKPGSIPASEPTPDPTPGVLYTVDSNLVEIIEATAQIVLADALTNLANSTIEKAAEVRGAIEEAFYKRLDSRPNTRDSEALDMLNS